MNRCIAAGAIVVIAGLGMSAAADAATRTTVALRRAGPAVAGQPARLRVRVRTPPGRRVLRYRLRFGDGSARRRGRRPPVSIRHTYRRPGVYRIVMRVTDSAHRTVAARLKLTVVPASRPPQPSPPPRTGASPPAAIEVNAAPVRVVAGTTAPVDTSAFNLTRVTGVSAPPGLSVLAPSSAEGLRIAASAAADPGTRQITVTGTGCSASACGLALVVHVTVTVAPIAAPAGPLDEFGTPAPNRPAQPIDTMPGAATLTDELLVMLGSDDAPGTRAQAESAAAANGAVVSGGIDELGVYEVRWTGAQDLQARKTGLLAQPNVTSVTESDVGTGGGHGIPSDWSDDGIYATWPFRMVEAPQTWDITHGSGVTVGIVDLGVPLTSHEDLKVRSLGGPAREHATHVAGLACARQNGIGLVGMAWGCPIVAAAGGKEEKLWLKAATDVARQPGVKVINLSLGYNAAVAPGVNQCATTAQLDTMKGWARDWKDKWRRLFTNEGAGIVWTISAGNSCAPVAASGMGANAGLSNVITVAAVNSEWTLASYSNFGPDVEVAAPGGIIPPQGAIGIWSTWMTPCGSRLCGTYAAQETLPGHGKVPITGTSMAAPMVAGIAALVRAAHPTFSASTAADCITKTAGVGPGRATERSPYPNLSNLKFEPHMAYTPATIPIVDAAAAVACSDSKVRMVASVTSGPAGFAPEITGPACPVDADESAVLEVRYDDRTAYSQYGLHLDTDRWRDLLPTRRVSVGTHRVIFRCVAISGAATRTIWTDPGFDITVTEPGRITRASSSVPVGGAMVFTTGASRGPDPCPTLGGLAPESVWLAVQLLDDGKPYDQIFRSRTVDLPTSTTAESVPLPPGAESGSRGIAYARCIYHDRYGNETQLEFDWAEFTVP